MNNVIQDDKVSDTKDVAIRKGTRWAVQCGHAKVLAMAWLQPSQLGGMDTVHSLAMPTVPGKEL